MRGVNQRGAVLRRARRTGGPLSVVATNARIAAVRSAGRPVIVLNREHRTLWPFVRPVLEALREREPSLYCVGTVRDTGVPREPGIDDLVDSVQGARIRGADLYLTPSVYGRAPRGAPSVLVPHNQPVRFSDYPRPEFAALRMILVMGSVHLAQCERTKQGYGLGPHPSLELVGYPKSDALHRGSYSRAAVLTQLGLDPERHTVIYTPAWEEHLSLREHGTRLFGVLCRIAEDSNVIVKLHPVSTLDPSSPGFEQFTGGKNWTAALRPFLQHPRMRHVVTDEVDPLLAAADVMITDMSSVALEFLALGRPVVYIDCPRFFELTLPSHYRRCVTADMATVLADPLVNAGRHVGLGSTDVDELPALVDRFRVNPDLLHAERRVYAAGLLCNRGVAAQAAADRLLPFLRGAR